MGVAGRLASRLARKGEMISRKALTPKPRHVEIEPLTEGTPLIQGGGRRAAAPAEQRGDEIPLMEGQPGARNVRRTAGEAGRREGVFDANLRDVKVVGGAAALTGLYAVADALLSSRTNRGERFRAAFASAREAGEKTFTFDGDKFHTKRVEELHPRPRKRPPSPAERTPRKKPPPPPADMKRGGMTKSKSRTGHKDYRGGGMVYSTKLKRG
jgi:hypothetical protein